MPVPPPLILILDDDETTRMFLAGICEREGYRTVGFGRKDEGLHWLRHHPADLVLTDIASPGLNGFEFLRSLRRDPVIRHTKVVVLSGSLDLKRAIEMKRLGAVDCLGKPFDEVDLIGVMRRALGEEFRFALPPDRAQDPGGRPRFVAILDDCPQYRKLFGLLMMAEGFEVVAHPDKAAFLELMPLFDPVLVITDLQCPGMDGVEFILRLKSRPELASVPVLVVTGYERDHPDVDRAIRVGVSEIVSKPINTADLVTRVLGILSNSR